MSRILRVFLALAVALAAAAVAPPPAGAQEMAPPPSLFDRAVAALDGEGPAAAIAVLEAGRDEPGFGPRLQGILGGLYAETGRFAEAWETLSPLAEAPGADPAVLYNAGRAALALGRSGKAREYLSRSVERAPGSPAARELGLLLGGAGQVQDAYLLLRPWVLAHPDDVEAGLAAAFCAVQLERAPEAEELLANLPQDNRRVRLLWGKLLLLKSDPWGAVATLKPALAEASGREELDVRRVMAEAYLMAGEAASAVELLSGRATTPALALELARALYQSGDPETAIATLEPFAEPALAETAGAPQDPALRGRLAFEYGLLLLNGGRQAEGLPYLELASTLDAGNKRVWQALARGLAATGQAERAREAQARFEQIVAEEAPISVQDQRAEKDALDPTGRELRKAQQRLAEDRAEEALGIARREGALAPDDPRPRLVESRALVELERVQEALAAAEAALRLAPGAPDAYYQRGVVKMALQDAEGAEEDLRLALEAAPAHTAAMNDLAVLLMTTGRDGEARRLLERVLELRPGDALARRNLERLGGGTG